MKYFKRAIITFLPIILIVFSLKMYITTKNFPETLNKIIYDSGIADIKIGAIEIQGFSEVKIHDVVINDLYGNNIIEAPLIKANINIFMPSKISKIDIYDGNINLVRNKNEHYNIYDIFKEGKQTNNIDRNSRIGFIDIHNATLNYKDLTFNKEVNQTLKSVEGFLEITKSRGFNIYATGNILNEKGVELEQSTMSIDIKNALHTNQSIYSLLDIYKNDEVYRKEFSIEFYFSNIPLNEELGQYSYLNIIEVRDGLLSGKLKLTNKQDNIEKPKGFDVLKLFRKNDDSIKTSMRFYGELDFTNLTIFYEDYSEDIDQIDGKVKFEDNMIFISGDTILNKDNENKDTLLEASYDLNETLLKMSLSIDNVKYSNLNKYKILKNLNVDANGNITGDIIFENRQKENKFILTGEVYSPSVSLYNYNFNKVKANINMEDNIFVMSDINFGFQENISNINVDVDAVIEKFSYDTINSVGELIYGIKNKNSDIKIDSLKGNAIIEDGIFKSNFISDKIKGDFIIDTNNKYLILDSKITNYLEISYNDVDYVINNGDIKGLKINFPDQNKPLLSTGQLQFNINLPNMDIIDNIQANVKVNKGVFQTDAVVTSLKERFKLYGTTTENMEHYYIIQNYDESIRLDKFIGENTAYLPVKFKSEIKGKDNFLFGNYDIYSSSGEFLIEYEDAHLYGSIYDLLRGDIDINGNMSEVWLGYQRLKNVNLDINVENNKININNIFNDKIKINGNYNLLDKIIDLDFNIDDYLLYNVSGLTEFNIMLSGVNGRLEGSINNLFGYINLNQPQVYADSKYIGEIKGDVLIENNVLRFNDIQLNDNDFNAYYDINSKEFYAKLNINEDSIPSVLNVDGLNFTLLSDLVISGKPNNFDLIGNVSINAPQYMGFKLPSARTNIIYTNGDIGRFLSYGELNIPDLSFYGDNGEEIFSTSTNLNLSDVYLDFNLKDKIFSLDSVEDLKEKGYNGDVILDVVINGRLDDLFVDFKANSEELILAGFLVKNLDIDMQMNNNELSLGQFYLEYEKNPLLINGYVSFKPIDYNVSLFANNFNLEFLGLDRNIRQSKGIADINIIFDKGETTGTVKLNDFSYISRDYSTELVNVNADIEVNNRKLLINRFDGGYNKGVFSLAGNIDVPGIPDDFMETKRLDLGSFELTTNFNNIGVKYGKGIDLNLTGNIIFTENNLFGNVKVNNGEIRELPEILINSITGTDNTKNEVKNESIIDGIISEIVDKVISQYTVNVEVQSNKNLKLKIPSISLVKNINGNLVSDLRLFYDTGDLGLWGNIYINGGNFLLNSNKFNISQLEVKFDNSGDASISNPFITFRAETKINKYRIEITKEGYLQSSDIVLRSDSALTREEIISLLLFNTLTNQTDSSSEFNDTVSAQEQSAAILTTLMDNTLNELIFSSITDKIENVLGLTSFSINTDVTNSSGESYSSSTTLKITNNLYKNKLFWNLEIEVPILDSSNDISLVDSSTEYVSSKNRNDLYYDFWINYNFSNGFDLKIGGDTKNRDYLNKFRNSISENRNSINYYIGADFTFRDYTLIDILKRVFNITKIEKLTK